jgi:hypothetical protein
MTPAQASNGLRRTVLRAAAEAKRQVATGEHIAFHPGMSLPAIRGRVGRTEDLAEVTP